MGQYYAAIIANEPLIQGNIQKNKSNAFRWLYSHDYDSGLKLMEHSWLKNPFVGTVCQLITEAPHYIVWAGDYADEESYELETEMQNGKLMPIPVNLHALCNDSNQISVDSIKAYSDEEQLKAIEKYKYLINHSKKEFVDITKSPDNDGWQIHPLPLLTCEGNGRGGGDYRDEDPDNLIGSWSRDLIELSSKQPDAPFKELDFNLREL